MKQIRKTPISTLRYIPQQVLDLPANTISSQGIALHCLRTDVPVDTLTKARAFISLTGLAELRPGRRERQSRPERDVEQFFQYADEIYDVGD